MGKVVRKTYRYNKGNKKQEDALIKALVKLTNDLKEREKRQSSGSWSASSKKRVIRRAKTTKALKRKSCRK